MFRIGACIEAREATVYSLLDGEFEFIEAKVLKSLNW